MMEKINELLNYEFGFGENVRISVKAIVVVIVTLFIASYVIRYFEN